MCGNGHGVNAQLVYIERDMQITLDGVGMEQGARGVRGGRKLADGLHHTGLVIGNHNAHERYVIAQQVAQRGGFDVARAAGLYQVHGKARGSQQR